MVVKRMGQRQDQKMMKNLANSPMPKNRTNSGKREKAFISPRRRSRGRRNVVTLGNQPPSRKPNGTAVMIAAERPRTVRSRLENAWTNNSPVPASLHPSAKIIEGGGINRESMKPLRGAISQ